MPHGPEAVLYKLTRADDAGIRKVSSLTTSKQLNLSYLQSLQNRQLLLGEGLGLGCQLDQVFF